MSIPAIRSMSVFCAIEGNEVTNARDIKHRYFHVLKITDLSNNDAKNLEVIPVNKIDNNLRHDILFIRLALGNHQGQCDQGIVCDAF